MFYRVTILLIRDGEDRRSRIGVPGSAILKVPPPFEELDVELFQLWSPRNGTDRPFPISQKIPVRSRVVKLVMDVESREICQNNESFKGIFRPLRALLKKLEHFLFLQQQLGNF